MSKADQEEVASVDSVITRTPAPAYSEYDICVEVECLIPASAFFDELRASAGEEPSVEGALKRFIEYGQAQEWDSDEAENVGVTMSEWQIPNWNLTVGDDSGEASSTYLDAGSGNISFGDGPLYRLSVSGQGRLHGNDVWNSRSKLAKTASADAVSVIIHGEDNADQISERFGFDQKSAELIAEAADKSLAHQDGWSLLNRSGTLNKSNVCVKVEKVKSVELDDLGQLVKVRVDKKQTATFVGANYSTPEKK